MTETIRRKVRSNGKFHTLSSEQQKEIVKIMSTFTTRAQLGRSLGSQYKGDRDLYKALGFKKVLEFEDFNSAYIRGDIAKRIVNAEADACWQSYPEVLEGNNPDETQFEVDWKQLVKDRSIWSYIHRIDKISGIGRYGILLLGFDDGRKLSEPVEKAKKLLFMRPIKEGNASIKEYEDNPKSERYGLPSLYDVTLAADGVLPKVSQDESIQVKGVSTVVHWSRVIHVAEGLTEDDIFGSPRLEEIYNLLHSLSLISGGGGEMFWRGAFPGLAFILDKDSVIDPTQGMTDLETEIDAYVHDMQRWMRLQGMEVENLAPQVADPSAYVDMYLSLISITKGIPKRILMGSERGELASSQDESAWNDRIGQRRINYCDPVLIRPLVDRLIKTGVLKTPTEDYMIKWPDISVPTEVERVTVAKAKSESLAIYSNALGASEIIPPEIFLKEFMELDEEVIEQAKQIAQEQMIQEEEEEKQAEEIRKQMEEEQRIKQEEINNVIEE